MRRLALLLALLGVLSLTALAVAAAQPSRTVTVSARDSGHLVVLKRGDHLVVRLAANPTTGYDWRLRILTAPLLVLEKRLYLAPRPSNPPVVGQGGVDVFRYRALRPGYATLRLVYVRPWQPGKVARSFTLQIRVR